MNYDEPYDLKSDPGQKNNVIDQYPELVSRFRSYYEKWWESIQPDLVNEDIIGPNMNPLKVAYWEQFGGGPDLAMLKKMNPLNRGHQSIVDKALAREEESKSKQKEKR